MNETEIVYNFQLRENLRPNLIIYRQTLDCLEQKKRMARRCKNNLGFQTERYIILLQLRKAWRANSQKYPRLL